MYNDPSEILTVEELAEALYIGKNSVYELLGSGELKAFKIGRTWKIPKVCLTDYINKKCGLLARY